MLVIVIGRGMWLTESISVTPPVVEHHSDEEDALHIQTSPC
jgi:hypothetical protein